MLLERASGLLPMGAEPPWVLLACRKSQASSTPEHSWAKQTVCEGSVGSNRVLPGHMCKDKLGPTLACFLQL